MYKLLAVSLELHPDQNFLYIKVFMILFYVRLSKRVHIMSTISEKSPAGLDSPAEARN